MMFRPIVLKEVSLSFSNKTCFEHFSSHIYPGSRIAIIGRNGSGKSSLVNILRGELAPSSGNVIIPDDLSIGYIPQTITECETLSGGQRLNKKLSEALSLAPDLLILDEPTNHLDAENRKSLMRMLGSFDGALILVSHDTELLRKCTHTLWHIDNNKVFEFSGTYDDYICKIKQNRASIEKKLSQLNHEKKEMHADLMKEQNRAAKSKAKGIKSIEQKKWPTVVSKAKAHKASHTSGKKKSAIHNKKQDLIDQLSELRLPDIILPKFSLDTPSISNGSILSIFGADIGYNKHDILLKNVSLELSGKERIAICGKNASGKSTLLKAILGEPHIFTTGSWHLPGLENIGYLDQHYSNLDLNASVIEHLYRVRPDWNEAKIRRHLSEFLFREKQEVVSLASTLSGGEKARLSLSLIAAKTPKLLILDELTNNLDLETKEHVVQVLRNYPGAMLIVSHDEDFLQSVGVDHVYKIEEGAVLLR